jgi:GT2 family glycosyltransferase
MDRMTTVVSESSPLRDDLVIVARQRAGDPELPAATVEAALAGSLAPTMALFDVIELPGPTPAEDTRLAAELAHHGHRVFSLGATVDDDGDPSDGVIPVPLTIPTLDPARQLGFQLAALGALRREATVETAVLVLRDPAWADAAVRARERWGWKVIAEASDATVSPRIERAAGLLLTGEPPPLGPGGGKDTRRGPKHVARNVGWSELDQAIRSCFPLTSVIVVSYDTLAYTRLCLASILANTEYPNYELIVVDNGSTDGSAAELRQLADRYPHLRVIENERNLGFSPANNQGLAIARGELLVLLNSDTIVSPGWLTRLARHLSDPQLGLIGAATNRAGNEAQVEAPYSTYGEFLAFARTRAAVHDGVRHKIRMPLMFCIAWRRNVLDAVGLLDERYETGMFEDEDYALRVKAAGYETAWAADAFVHHAYHASIGKLLPSGDYVALFRRNQERFEQKWGICWERHRPPPKSPPRS